MLVKSERYEYAYLHDFIDDKNYIFFANKIKFKKKYKDLTMDEMIKFVDKVISFYGSDQGAIIDYLTNQPDSYLMTFQEINDRNEDTIVFYKII